MGAMGFPLLISVCCTAVCLTCLVNAPKSVEVANIFQAARPSPPHSQPPSASSSCRSCRPALRRWRSLPRAQVRRLLCAARHWHLLAHLCCNCSCPPNTQNLRAPHANSAISSLLLHTPGEAPTEEDAALLRAGGAPAREWLRARLAANLERVPRLSESEGISVTWLDLGESSAAGR